MKEITIVLFNTLEEVPINMENLALIGKTFFDVTGNEIIEALVKYDVIPPFTDKNLYKIIHNELEIDKSKPLATIGINDRDKLRLIARGTGY